MYFHYSHLPDIPAGIMYFRYIHLPYIPAGIMYFCHSHLPDIPAGIMYFRYSEGTVRFVDSWLDTINAKPDYWDQNAFNDMARAAWDPVEKVWGFMNTRSSRIQWERCGVS
jgi:hypothetical protein